MAREQSQRLRYISIAKAMAIKSKDLTVTRSSNPFSPSKLINFNTTHDGYRYDNDVYNGLFFALRTQKHPLTKVWRVT